MQHHASRSSTRRTAHRPLGQTWLIWGAMLLMVAGCAPAKPAFIWPWWKAGTAPIPRTPWPTAAQEAELSSNARSAASLRAGSTVMNARAVAEADVAPSGLGASPAASGPADAETMAEVLRELQSLNHLTPAEQQRLLAELKGHESSAWPALVRKFRESLPPPTQLAAAPAAPGSPTTTTTASVPRATLTGQVAPLPAGGASSLTATPTAPPGDRVIQASATLPAPSLPTAAPTTAAPPNAPPAVEPQSAPAAAPTAGQAAPAILPGESPRAAVGDWQFHLAAAIGALEAQMASAPEATAAAAEHARLGLLYLAAGRRDDALRPLSAIPAEQQEFWAKELTGLSLYLESLGHAEAGERVTEATAHLEAARRALHAQAELTLRNLAFCTEVLSYGVYEPFASTEFAPGQEVLLYAELENLKSDPRAGGYYTALQSRYEVLDAAGKVVDTREFGLTEETCRNERRDFFIRYQFLLPKGLAAGAYTLKLQIEDTLGRKSGSASIPFSIKP
ncbi:MAG: hypothetical protein JNG90_07255 [Planctomycetaceae bacterium]|nr:hypothetical protein [Planctomycetaceae bacterium]